MCICQAGFTGTNCEYRKMTFKMTFLVFLQHHFMFIAPYLPLFKKGIFGNVFL